MADYSDMTTAVKALQNDATKATDLTQIAAAQPALRAQVATHRSADAALLDWLDSVGDHYVKAAVAARRDHDARPKKKGPAATPKGTGKQGDAADAAEDNPTTAKAQPAGTKEQPKKGNQPRPYIDVEPTALRRETRVEKKNFTWLVVLIVLAAMAISSAGTYFITRAYDARQAEEAAKPVTPPDGNSADPAQAAWITVPSTSTKADALIVDVHFDYQCPYCEILESGFDQAFEDLNARGDIVLRQHTRTFLDGVGSETMTSSSRAAIAAACVDVADKTKYAAYHNAIYKNQPKEGVGFTDQQLRVDFATTAGLKGKALTKFQQCFDNRATAAFVRSVENNNKSTTANQAPPNAFLYGGNDPLYYDQNGRLTTPDQGTQGGVYGTPSMFVNGKQVNWAGLFDQQSWNPVVPQTADGLLAYLQQAIA